MKLLGKISVLFAGTLLILHGLLPHEHHDEMAGVEHFVAHKQVETWIDYLQVAFHFSPGDNHLEEYQTSDYYISVDLLPVDVEWAIITLNIEDNSVFLTDASLEKLQRTLSQPWRGPPSLS